MVVIPVAPAQRPRRSRFSRTAAARPPILAALVAALAPQAALAADSEPQVRWQRVITPAGELLTDADPARARQAALRLQRFALLLPSAAPVPPLDTQTAVILAVRDGDTFLLSDPYAGGVFHIPDQVIATPVFVDGEVLGFCLSLTHKADVGGMAPGSSSAGAREIWQEGLILPPVRYWTKDGVVKDIEAIVTRNSRSAEALAGDLRAQVGCTHVGAQRLRALCAEYGTQTIKRAFVELQDLAGYFAALALTIPLLTLLSASLLRKQEI